MDRKRRFLGPAGHQQATASQSVTNCSQDTKLASFLALCMTAPQSQVLMCTWPSSDSVSFYCMAS